MKPAATITLLLRIALPLYPFYIWFAISHWHPAAALLPGILLALLQSFLPGSHNLKARLFFLCTAILLLIAMLFQQAERALLFYPVWISTGLLLLFSWSLWYPPTVIERLAVLMEGPLDHKGITYTRKVTQVWCVFFLINGAIACFTALWGNWDLWLLYNGGISYGLMGLLMLIEWRIRKVVKAAK